MAKKPKKGDKSTSTPRIQNRRARHDYHIHESLECGIVLQGSEVKSIREGRVSLAEGYARVDANTHELWLHDVEISHYANASVYQHDAKTKRKLLAHKREIDKLLTETGAKGTTLVPLTMYFKDGRVKVEIGVATGKKQHDKREDMKTRDAHRDMRRAMSKRM